MSRCISETARGSYVDDAKDATAAAAADAEATASTARLHARAGDIEAEAADDVR